MFGVFRATEKMKANNEKYTQECKNIYFNLHFAQIKEVKLWSEMLYFVYGIFIASIVAIIVGGIIGSSLGYERSFAYRFSITILIIVMCSILLVATILCVKSYKKKGRQFYIIKNDDGEYQFEVEDINGKLYLKYMADIRKRKGISIEGEKCSIYSWREKSNMAEDIGFYQYLVHPTKVYPHYKLRISSPYLYKKKKVIGNRIYYRFYSSYGGVVGARYGRCIKLKNGVIKYITEQEPYGKSRKGNVMAMSYKYIYNYVNDNSVKIYIPRYVWEYAKKNKFTFPKECENLCYEE
ncbi:MAG: hypothetical protein K2K85_04035 [Clostridia bacterium]|nr:hypothetical protein [Clostridia bacterium]